jgi:microcystin-dependent protein
MTFNQTAAPTGWTKSTTTNNAGFRLVSGTVGSGGSVDFTTAFASKAVTGTVSTSISSVSGSAGATTLSTPQIPSHSHTFGASPFSVYAPVPGPVTLATVSDTGNTGGGGSHTHPFSFSSGSATSSFSGNALNLAVKYVDLIIAQKN